MLYGPEFWAAKNEHMQKRGVAEIVDMSLNANKMSSFLNANKISSFLFT